MNTFNGIITHIESSKNISLIDLRIGDIAFKAILIDRSDTNSYLIKEGTVKVIFKETEVVIGKGIDHHISMQNKIVGRISQIDKGRLLSKLLIATSIGEVKSIVTSNAIEELQLSVGEEVTAMIKTNEIMLST